MTEAKPDPKPRSAFMPILLLVVGLVIVAGVVLVYVPIFTCDQCAGLRMMTYAEIIEARVPSISDYYFDQFRYSSATRDDIAWACGWCHKTGKLKLYMWLTSKDPDSPRKKGEVGPNGQLLLERVIEARQSSP